MTDLINGDVLTTLAQVIMIDLVLAGDNAVVIGLAAAGLPNKQRNRAILIGIVIATVLRIIGATVATQLLQVLGLLLAGGIAMPLSGSGLARFAALPIALAGEILGRYLFYASVVPKNIAAPYLADQESAA